jgi:signal transduction histidine kinase
LAQFCPAFAHRFGTKIVMLDPHRIALALVMSAVAIAVLALGTALVLRYLAARAKRKAGALGERVAVLELANRELKRALDLAEEASRSKTQFLSTMGHELRTPLNAIIGFSELLLTEPYGKLGDPSYRDYAQDIHDSGKHLLGLMNDVLDNARLDGSMVVAYQEPADLADVVQKICRALKPQAERAGIALIETVDPLLPMARTDEKRLRQVLHGLVTNAIRFTAAAGSVSVSAYRQGKGVAISIADTGAGIAPDEIAKATDNLGQMELGWTRSQDRGGLSLPLAKRLVEVLGGNFVLESEVGLGSNIILTFPPERLLERQQPLAA